MNLLDHFTFINLYNKYVSGKYDMSAKCGQIEIDIFHQLEGDSSSETWYQ